MFTLYPENIIVPCVLYSVGLLYVLTYDFSVVYVNTISSLLSCKCIIITSIHVTPYIIDVHIPYLILFTTPVYPHETNLLRY